MTTPNRPRSLSMTDALRARANGPPEQAFADMLNGLYSERRATTDFANSLPKLTETDLEALGQTAEEETALAMDSPAHPLEELGVTRLSQTCGHVFCRKDSTGQLDDAFDLTDEFATAPIDIETFLQSLEMPANMPSIVRAFVGALARTAPSAEVMSEARLRSSAPRREETTEAREEGDEHEHEHEHEHETDSHDYSGMYS
ncbi:uncharacterized protein FIBRA_05668 [Fibroporia radiculosa]|uniref:Uncharacterized protein n=1 Tax=Fibroporia radiculosa TaxID=599839 RepID=J4H3N1_9APHY|nr:uncharacterized protein FIBRA_05668 [Fibroporia radiculosa]CCM03534.1 predicted protein [Fibroporia radiculosa]